jgi:hypothetical protein
MEKIDTNLLYESLKSDSSIGRLILASSLRQIEVLISVWSVIQDTAITLSCGWICLRGIFFVVR